ncbi:putative protein OS=Streptomyces aurantiogriseus OX=66870 GN=GCM10010251_22380 PE=4 SV=1 [Streptomyces aurantiogriseus]|uniref:Uncharacterized protein n=1 Tax=Streptomyces aurantiogriseus TaxID=66870 RepID=A0A918C538_9ACTN|nr:hypothetical protein GCM10010251_22380 [Streptomyces aurantiogriseus]
MSEERGPNWAEMRREDFEAAHRPKPAPPGQMELFEPGPARAKAKQRSPEGCSMGTLSLLDLLTPEP